MKGSKRISNLITSKDQLLTGRINIIEANVSAGKTWFALNTLPEWAGGNPERILYLIDTNNGEMYLQRNMLTVDRQMYAFCDYNTKHVWGENAAERKMPVMTYSGFGAEVMRNHGHFHWLDFDYIVCDEMQNLVNYRKIDWTSSLLMAAEMALRMIALEGTAKIVGLSATPQAIREHFGSLCRDVPFDRTELVQLETFARIPYSKRTPEEIIQQHKGKTGILYVSDIATMKKYIDYANSIGVRANGFWSIHAEPQYKHPFTDAQRDLRHSVLQKDAIPADIDLLVINAASETCIKIKQDNRIVDYMIVHDKNDEVQTQVRGRYDADLAEFYFHDEKAAIYVECPPVPERFLNVRLYADGQEKLCQVLALKRPNAAGIYSIPTVVKVLRANGYTVYHKKDSKKNGTWYYYIHPKCTSFAVSL